ncbi:MAG TPA: gliding motility protein GldM, partial [Chitinophagaceae bacterium]|nr:gliding motility protein GldM [Chitinophagaceae bacterium]
MALPKEPRQKMINLMYLVLTALLALNVSSEILNAFKVVDSSLITSNTNLDAANNTLFTS